MAAGILFFISYGLRKKLELFSMILFGGAMATAYFTTYGAFAYYSLLTSALAFGLMALLTVFTVYESLKNNRKEIAVLGLVGAYGIPFLVRGDKDNALLLFTYIFIINIGVLFLLFKKYWSSLIYLSFSMTWMIFFSWAFFIEAPDRITGIAFSVLFFLLFAISAIAFKVVRKQEINQGDVIIFLLNLLAFYFALITLRSTPIAEYPTTLTLFGLFAVTLLKLILLDSLSFTAVQKIIAYVLMGTLLLIISFLYQKYKNIIFGEDQGQ